MLPATSTPTVPTSWEAFAYWLWLGFSFFGGHAAQIALMNEDLIELKRWISEARFLHSLSFCMVLPIRRAIPIELEAHQIQLPVSSGRTQVVRPAY
jgi:hypothetical protein